MLAFVNNFDFIFINFFDCMYLHHCLINKHAALGDFYLKIL